MPATPVGERPEPVVAPHPVPGEADFQPISRVKITATPHREQTLSRDRLLDWVRGGLERRLSLVVAEAGYGKSTLLVDFARGSEARCLWYKLDPTDGDWVTFLNYLIASAREAWPEFGRSTAALLGHMAVQDPPRELVIATFIAELGHVPKEAVLWIFDDFHVVDESPDVREILERMLRDAPASVHFCLATRRPPELPLARLRAQGELSELDTQQMRFSLEETDRLFGEVYGQPLESDILKQVDDRTEGWAASLQLLNSSIRGRSKLEIRAFVRAMTGAEGPLYDFLAEEVLGELDAELRRFLLHASVLERITVDYVAAALERDGDRPTADQVKAWMVDATDMGLLGRADPIGKARTLHPLLREFLTKELSADLSEDEIRAVHRRVGRAASPEDWLPAARHLLKASEHEDAARVVSNSVARALGTGEWGGASEVITAVGGAGSNAALLAILARAEIAQGRGNNASALLSGLDVSGLDPLTRATVRFASISAAWNSGEMHGRGIELAEELIRDKDAPSQFVAIASAYIAMVRSSAGGPLAPVLEQLRRIANDQVAGGLHYFAGISLHNATTLCLAMGEYRHALDLGFEALAQFRQVPVEMAEQRATLSTMATCAYELGSYAEGHDLLERALAPGPIDHAAIADAANLAAWTGQPDRAAELCDRSEVGINGSMPDSAAQFMLVLARCAIAMVTGTPLPSHLQIIAGRATEFGAAAMVLQVRAHAALRSGDLAQAASMAAEAMSLGLRQGGGRCATRASVVVALAGGDRNAVTAAVSRAVGQSAMAPLELADSIADQLHLLDPLPRGIRDSIVAWPQRWLPALRRQLHRGRHAAAVAAASLLDELGTETDVSRLRAYERTYLRGTRARGLGRELARRLGARLIVGDLGRVELQLGERRIDLSGVRKKAATLLVYLLARPDQTATREQAIDDLWPDADPAAGINNLNQTLYFLRRELDPWYDDDTSPEYVHFRKELLWLDRELVSAASVRFEKALPAALATVTADPKAAMAVLDQYSGRFAPEFEYDEWAMGWRDRLQAMYLHGVEVLTRALALANGHAEAIPIVQRAVAIAPDSSELERLLIWLYASVDARSAAAEQYAHYATAYREEYGEEPASLQDICATPP